MLVVGDAAGHGLPAARRAAFVRAYAGIHPAMWLETGEELLAAEQGIPLGLNTDLECVEGSRRTKPARACCATRMA